MLLIVLFWTNYIYTKDIEHDWVLLRRGLKAFYNSNIALKLHDNFLTHRFKYFRWPNLIGFEMCFFRLREEIDLE